MSRCVPITFVMMTVSAFLVTGVAVGGDWEDEVPVIQDPILQYEPRITIAPDDTVYVGWLDETDFDHAKIMLTSSIDRGHTWISPWITFEGHPYVNVDICADADTLHLLLVKYKELPHKEYKWLYYARSEDGGETFTAPVQVGTRENIEHIKLCTSPGYIFVYAQDLDPDTGEVYNYLYVSDDGGASWTEKPLLPGLSVELPAFAVQDGRIHMAYGTNFCTGPIRYAQSDDNGDNWSAPVTVSNGAPAQYTQNPDIAVDDSAIHVTWEDNRAGCFGCFNILYSRSSDGGLTWSTNEQLNDTFYGARAKLLADAEGLHVVWTQFHGDVGWPESWSTGNYGIIWYKSSTDSGLTWSDEFRVSQNEDIDPINLPSMGADDALLAQYSTGFCAMWRDRRDGNIDLYLRNNLGPVYPGDMNCDGTVNFGDINPFVQILTDFAGWQAAHPGCPWRNGDINTDATVNFGDINPFVALLTGAP